MIVFSDLDGTFLDSHKEIPAANREALDALAQTGGMFVPCSGRPLTGMPREILEHPAVRYAISANGATVTDLRTNQAIHQTGLGLTRALKLYELTRGRDVTFDFFADDHDFIARADFDRLGDFTDDPYLLKSMQDTRTPFDGDPVAFAHTLHNIERIAYYWRDPADRAAIWAEAERDPSVAVVQSYDNNIEVSDRAASKGSSLVWLCGHLGVDVADVVAFGDHINDISMVESAGTGGAVANARPETIAAADVVVASNDEAGPGRWILEQLGR